MKLDRALIAQRMASNGMTVGKICRVLTCSQSTAYRWLSRSPRVEKHRKPRASVIVRRKRLEVLRRKTTQNTITGWTKRDFPSSRSMAKEMFRRHGVKISHQTICRDLKNLGASCRVRAFVPSITPKHIVGRHNFVTKHRRLNNVVWSDETMVLLNDCSCRTEWVRTDEQRTFRVKDGWATRVLVWGAIAKGWRSPLVVITFQKDEDGATKRMDSARYIRCCLAKIKSYLVSNNKILMHDGARAHTSKQTCSYLHRNGIKWLEGWPAKSPDLNGIETCWSYLKRKVSLRMPSTAEDLVKTIKEEWTQIPQSMMDKWSAHYNSRSAEVRAASGGW